MSSRNILIIVAVVVVLAILGYRLHWFGGGAPEPAAPTATPPAAPATTNP